MVTAALAARPLCRLLVVTQHDLTAVVVMETKHCWLEVRKLRVRTDFKVLQYSENNYSISNQYELKYESMCLSKLLYSSLLSLSLYHLFCDFHSKF